MSVRRWSPPIVRVGHPYIPGTGPAIDRQQDTDLVALWCSDCGDLSEWETDNITNRDRLRREALRHATEKHEGLVDAVGWVR